MFNALPAPLDVAQMDNARRSPVNGYDVYPDTLYSTMVYPAVGQLVNVPLQFFQGAETVPSDKSLTNVPQGVLPGGQKFHVRALFIVPLIETAVIAPTTTLDGSGISRDVDRVFKTNRGQWSYTQTNIQRTRGPFPLDGVGEQAGILPDFGGNNVPAAANNAVYQHSRLAAIGGWPMDFIIYETENFPFNLTWGVQTAITTAMPIQLRLYGWRYIKTG